MKNINNVTILDYSEIYPETQKETELEINELVSNTANTWQQNRSNEEKKADTKIGKFAEDSVIAALNLLDIKNYHSYDSFRQDKFTLHAPFDGIFCKNFNDEIAGNICNEVKELGAKLTGEFRDELRRQNIITVEIKSTRLADKYKERAKFEDYNKPEHLNRLIKHLNTLDFLTYPFYTRCGDMSFTEYCYYVEKNFLHSGLYGRNLQERVKKIELQNSSNIYIRVFVDEYCKKVLIMGWIGRKIFFDSPKTHKLILPGKSEKALYFVKSLSCGKNLSLLKSLLEKCL